MPKPRIRRHLFVREPPQNERFTSVHAGGSKPRMRGRNRRAHARKLEAELEAASAAVAGQDRPIRIEFRSEPGFELALASLDSSRPGTFELLSVRQVGTETIATVFVTRKGIAHFRRAIEAYATKDTRGGRPIREALVANVATIRRASVQSIWMDEESRLRRIIPPDGNAPVVCLLDTGVNRGHLLLEPVLDARSVLSCDPSWAVHDHDGHGTEMAGLAAFGDLAPLLLSRSPLPIRHRLESVKILPPTGDNDPDVYGAVTQEAVARAEQVAPRIARAVCLTVTAKDGRDRGMPSSWSAAIDHFAAGALDDQRRLFCISAGNADVDAAIHYPVSNESDSIHDPGQSWNALTVGAVADRHEITEPDFSGWSAAAPTGDLGPCSTTSCNWPHPRPWPIKPDVLMAGGNVAISPDGARADCTDSLSLLTTHWMPLVRQFSATGDTSAAAALAARLAARIHAEYPDMWPETVAVQLGVPIETATTV